MKILPSGVAVLDEPNWISKWVEQSGRLDHDQTLLSVLLNYIHEGDWVIDGGAFIGDHTKAYLKQVGETGKVIAFEPNKEAFECLVYNCKDSINLNVGLSDKFGSMNMISGENKGATYGVPGDSVATINLDLLGLPRLNFMKLDIEGMEVKAIHGAKQTILKHKPVICVELNKSALERNGSCSMELVDTIVGLGYETKKVYPGDNIYAPQLDLLFIPL